MLQAFEKEIARKYQVYNGLFLDLPFEKLEEAGSHLPLFFNHCKKGLSNKLSPVQSVEDFFGVKSKLASFEKDTSKEVNTINSRTTQLGFVAKLASYHFK